MRLGDLQREGQGGWIKTGTDRYRRARDRERESERCTSLRRIERRGGDGAGEGHLRRVPLEAHRALVCTLITPQTALARVPGGGLGCSRVSVCERAR